MKIEVKKISVTKSIIMQMEYICVPFFDVDVLGWVNIDKKTYTIVKSAGKYYKGEYVAKLHTEAKGVQFSLPDGGYEYPVLINVSCETANRGLITFSPHRENSHNEDFAVRINNYILKTRNAGQIYY
jgi:hypothetical protein